MAILHRTRLLVTIAVILLALLAVFARPLWQQYRLSMARKCLRTHQVDEALVWLEAAEAHNSDDAEVQFLMARTHRRRGAFELCRRHVQEAWRLGFPVQRLEREQWLALAQSGQIDEAEPHLDELLADPQGDVQEICDAYVAGYLRVYRFDPALELLDAWQADFPKDPQPLFWRARIWEHTFADHKAVDLYREAVELAPYRTDLRSDLAALLSERREFDEAEEHFRHCAKEAPDNIEILAGWGNCLLEQQQTDRARKLFSQALEKDPTHFQALYGLGRLELRAGEKHEALKWLELAYEQNPKHSRMRFALASALRDTGQTQAAKAHYQYYTDAKKALDELDDLMGQVFNEPDLVETRYQVGMKLIEYVSSVQGAIWLQSVLQLDPSHAPTHEALAAHYAEQDKPDVAEKHRRLAAEARDKPASSEGK